MRIGIDFDNTLASYDHVFTALAVERGWIGEPSGVTKQSLRERVRLLPNGEILWQRLQGEVYGPRMQQAIQFDGVDAFLRRAAATPACQLFIVSHKTEFGHFDETGCNLRTAARQWMHRLGYFDPAIYALAENQVFFEATQQAKAERIASLNCDYFIDDLLEFFSNPAFPAATLKILYSSAAPNLEHRQVDYVCANWQAIEAIVFGN